MVLYATKKWKTISPKVIFLLKETNGKLNSLSDYLSNTSKYMKKYGVTWFNVARWSYGIQHIDTETKWSELNELNNENLSEYLKYICAINIKKTPGKGTTNQSEINKAVKDYGNKTIEQIQLYKAKFLILGGTGDYFEIMYPEKINWSRTSRGIWYSKLFNETYVIWYYHPGAHFPKQFIFYNLMDAIKELTYT